MPDIPLGRADYHRTVAKEARVQTRNRYYEQNPVLTGTATALISRPALRRWLPVGDGPILGVYTQPGCFDDALFVVSGDEWWRVDKDGTKTLITGGINPLAKFVSMAGTGNIGETPEFMFLADGRNLWLYRLTQNYTATINFDAVMAGDQVSITVSTGGGSTGFSVTAGTEFAIGATPADTAQNFINVFTPPEDYAQYFTLSRAGSTVTITEAGPGGTVDGPAYAPTPFVPTGQPQPQVSTVETPNDVGIISLGYTSSYVICVPAQGEGINGRYYWIDPGEIVIDPLDFATAERAPDPIYQVVVFGDQFWLPGQSTTEVWYFTGNAESPVARLQGVAFNRGTWAGTALQVKESMIIVDSDGGVFQISGGLKRISNPAIEERIREVIQYQAALGF